VNVKKNKKEMNGNNPCGWKQTFLAFPAHAAPEVPLMYPSAGETPYVAKCRRYFALQHVDNSITRRNIRSLLTSAIRC
jgi:hypothetical protein